MATKPTIIPLWNTGGANRATPSGAKQTSGWVSGEDPSSAEFNWLTHYVGQWCQYVSDGDFSGDHVFSGNIGVVGDFTDEKEHEVPLNISPFPSDYDEELQIGAALLYGGSSFFANELGAGYIYTVENDDGFCINVPAKQGFTVKTVTVIATTSSSPIDYSVRLTDGVTVYDSDTVTAPIGSSSHTLTIPSGTSSPIDNLRLTLTRTSTGTFGVFTITRIIVAYEPVSAADRIYLQLQDGDSIKIPLPVTAGYAIKDIKIYLIGSNPVSFLYAVKSRTNGSGAFTTIVSDTFSPTGGPDIITINANIRAVVGEKYWLEVTTSSLSDLQIWRITYDGDNSIV